MSGYKVFTMSTGTSLNTQVDSIKTALSNLEIMETVAVGASATSSVLDASIKTALQTIRAATALSVATVNVPYNNGATIAYATNIPAVNANTFPVGSVGTALTSTLNHINSARTILVAGLVKRQAILKAILNIK